MPTQEEMTKAIYEAMFPPKKTQQENDNEIIAGFRSRRYRNKAKRLSKSKN